MENRRTQTEGLKSFFFADGYKDFLQSKVEIDPAMQRDAGYYECQAYNKHAVETKVTLF